MRKSLLAAAAAALIFLNFAGANAAETARAKADAVAGESVSKVSVSIRELAFNSGQTASVSTSASANASADASAPAADSDATDRAPASAVSVAASSGGSASASVEGKEAAASSAAGIFVTTSDDTCMGSSGVGGQGTSFGLSLGSTWTDSNCIMLKNARELLAQGHPKAARARLCMNEDNALAFELAGEPCPRQLASTQAALAKIRAIDPDYVAEIEPGLQFASLNGTDDGAAAASTADNAAQPGTLLAMVQSVVHGISNAFSASGSGADLSNAYPFDGVE